jgi:hypothetical protein
MSRRSPVPPPSPLVLEPEEGEEVEEEDDGEEGEEEREGMRDEAAWP